MSGRVALLDVNVLVALFDPDHIHHELAHDWFADHRVHGWATCPITENGVVRVLSNPSYGLAHHRTPDLVARLRRFCASGHHTFWSGSVSLLDQAVFKPSLLRGHRQLTDIYLLGLAVTMRGCLATFDRTIPLSVVAGATQAAIQTVAPVESQS